MIGAWLQTAKGMAGPLPFLRKPDQILWLALVSSDPIGLLAKTLLFGPQSSAHLLVPAPSNYLKDWMHHFNRTFRLSSFQSGRSKTRKALTLLLAEPFQTPLVLQSIQASLLYHHSNITGCWVSS